MVDLLFPLFFYCHSIVFVIIVIVIVSFFFTQGFVSVFFLIPTVNTINSSLIRHETVTRKKLRSREKNKTRSRLGKKEKKLGEGKHQAQGRRGKECGQYKAANLAQKFLAFNEM